MHMKPGSKNVYAIPLAFITGVAILWMFPEPQSNFALYAFTMVVVGSIVFFVVRWALR